MLNEDDYPKGHPKRFDYDPDSVEALEWARIHVHPRGERDFPVDHPKAQDTTGNHNRIQWTAGIDPHHLDREAFTGRTAAQAKAAREAQAKATGAALETPPRVPLDAAVFKAEYRAECERLGVQELTAEQYRTLLERVEGHYGTRN